MSSLVFYNVCINSVMPDGNFVSSDSVFDSLANAIQSIIIPIVDDDSGINPCEWSITQHAGEVVFDIAAGIFPPYVMEGS